MPLVPVREGTAMEMVVDTDDVMVMLQRAELALNPIVLEAFLAGDVLQYFQGDIAERFNNEGDDKVGDWQPLKESTQAIREAQGYAPDDILIRSGDLWDFLLHEERSRALAGGAILEVPGPSSGKMAEKIKTAQVGSLNNPPFGPTPARPVLAADEADLVAVMIFLHHHLMESLLGREALVP